MIVNKIILFIRLRLRKDYKTKLENNSPGKQSFYMREFVALSYLLKSLRETCTFLLI